MYTKIIDQSKTDTRVVVYAAASKLDRFASAPNKAAKGAFSKIKRAITNKELVIQNDMLNEKVRGAILVGKKDYNQESVMKLLFSIDSTRVYWNLPMYLIIFNYVANTILVLMEKHQY